MPPIKRRQITPEEAKARLEVLCARAEKCTYELRTKLRAWQVHPAEAERIISELEEARFVDDARFARAFVRDKMRFERRGRLWLRQALAAKRIGRDLINEAFDEIDEGEYLNNLEHTLRQRLGRNPELGETFEGRTKVYRYGITRGYEPELVGRVLREILRK